MDLFSKIFKKNEHLTKEQVEQIETKIQETREKISKKNLANSFKY